MRKGSKSMKSTKEMIEVMQAYESGERIQVKNIADNTKWKEIEFPGWNWIYYDYRVKPKSKYIPFETAEEFLTAQRKHGKGLISIDNGEILEVHNISISPNGDIYKHTQNNYSGDCKYVGDLKYLFEEYRMADGTPCGKEVEV